MWINYAYSKKIFWRNTTHKIRGQDNTCNIMVTAAKNMQKKKMLEIQHIGPFRKMCWFSVVYLEQKAIKKGSGRWRNCSNTSISNRKPDTNKSIKKEPANPTTSLSGAVRGSGKICKCIQLPLTWLTLTMKWGRLV